MKEQMFPDDCDRLMSLDEVRMRLHTSPANVARLVKSGMLITLKFGNFKRVRKATFNEFLRRDDGKDLLDELKEAEKE